MDGGYGGAGDYGGWIFLKQFADGTKPALFDPKLGSVYPYVKNTQVFVCPSDAGGQASGNSYAANYCTEMQGSAQPHVGRILAAFDTPSSMMELSEEAATNTPNNDSTDDGILWYGPDAVNNVSKRHTGGSNVALMDGHVKWYTADAVKNQNLQTGGVASANCP